MMLNCNINCKFRFSKLSALAYDSHVFTSLNGHWKSRVVKTCYSIGGIMGQHTLPFAIPLSFQACNSVILGFWRKKSRGHNTCWYFGDPAVSRDPVGFPSHPRRRFSILVYLFRMSVARHPVCLKRGEAHVFQITENWQFRAPRENRGLGRPTPAIVSTGQVLHSVAV